jgi:hypothetical protein
VLNVSLMPGFAASQLSGKQICNGLVNGDAAKQQVKALHAFEAALAMARRGKSQASKSGPERNVAPALGPRISVELLDESFGRSLADELHHRRRSGLRAAQMRQLARALRQPLAETDKALSLDVHQGIRDVAVTCLTANLVTKTAQSKQSGAGYIA